jgi:parvulin-like peptidyl-prolyl isomerase
MPLLINGQPIDDAVLDNEFAQIKAYFERLGNVSCCERDPEFRGYARQNVVGRVLLAQEAQRALPPTPAEEVEAALDKLKEEHGGEGRFLAMIGATPDQLDLVRKDLEAELRVRRLVDDLCAADAEPGEAELRRYYDEHLPLFMTAEEVRASHIMKAPNRGEQREQAYQELREVRNQLLAGADFDELARTHSDKAQDHIDLGFFKRGELAEEFELVAFSMEVGELSPVFASPFGFHVVKLTERKPSVPKPFDEVRDEVRQHLVDNRRQEKTKQLVEQLQAAATIEDVESTAEAVSSAG